MGISLAQGSDGWAYRGLAFIATGLKRKLTSAERRYQEGRKRIII